MSAWRAALRIAWREALRAKGRSAMVLAMIALPVLALSFLAVDYGTFTLSPGERADRMMGRTQAVLSWSRSQAVEQDPAELTAFGVALDSPTPEQPRTPQETDARLLALLPAGSTIMRDQSTVLSVQTASGIGDVATRLLDYGDPRAEGILRPLDGRAPRAADEVALTPAAVTRIGAGIGATVRTADGGRTFHIVGTVENPSELKAATMVLRPDALADVPVRDVKWLAATPSPLTWAQVKQLNTHGVTAVSREVLANPPSEAERYDLGFGIGGGPPAGVLTLIAGLAVLEVVLLAGPAFAVGARRRRRDLALVAASGGTPAHLRRIVLADGVVLGAAAAGFGLLVGVTASVAARPMLETVFGVRSGALRFYPVALAALAALAVVTGLLAALVPAWIAARQDVVTALAGRRGITRSRRRWILLGVGLMVGGGVLAAFGATNINLAIILIGLVLVEFGIVLCTPAIVGLVARTGRWLPVSLRIALRSASRNRTAAAPAIAAVMAAVAGSLAVGVVVAGQTTQERNNYYPAGPAGSVNVFDAGDGPVQNMSDAVAAAASTALRERMPVDQIYPLAVPLCGGLVCFIQPRWPAAHQCPYGYDVLQRAPNEQEQAAARRDPKCDGVSDRYHIAAFIGMPALVIAEDAVAAVTLAGPDEVRHITAALRSGAVVVDDARYLDGGQVTLSIPTGGTKDAPTRTATVPGFARAKKTGTARVLMTKATADSLGLTTRTTALLATMTRVPTQAEEDQLRAALTPVSDGIVIQVERGPQSTQTQLVIVAIVAGLVTLIATALATGLAAADGRSELATLAAIGASPRLRRTLTLSQSGVVAGLGSVLGAVAGLGASTAVLFSLNQVYARVWPAPVPLPIEIPWANVGIALVAVPVVAMLGAGLLTRSRLPIERRE